MLELRLGFQLGLFQAMTGGDLFSSYSGVFMVQIICFLAAAFLTRRLDVSGFRAEFRPVSAN